MSFFLQRIPESGNVALIISCVIHLFYFKFNKNLFYARVASVSSFSFVTLSFVFLIIAHVNDDFTLRSVYETSSINKSVLYKILGTWGNYEGSMLLWVWVISLYSILMEFLIPKRYRNISEIAIFIQNILCFSFTLFVLFLSNPFERLNFIALDGIGLNPILQDIALGIHPPILYLGYIGFSSVFSISLACAFLGFDSKKWEKITQPWMFFALSLLTVGIGLGSWWAYRELGWGGFWFWDPVENAALIPWICGIIAVHFRILTRKYGLLTNSSYFFSVLSFCASVMGVVITRSGIVASVHSFSVHSGKSVALSIIFLMICFFGGAGFFFFVNGHKNKSTLQGVKFFSNIFLSLVSALIFCVILSIVVMGTLYPFILEFITSEVISVGAPYYNSTLGVVCVFLFLFLSCVFYSNWTKIALNLHSLLILGISILLSFDFIHKVELIPFLIINMIVFILCSAIYKFVRVFLFGEKVSRRFIGLILVHSSLAIFAFGAISSSLLDLEYNGSLKVESSFRLGSFSIRLEGITFVKNEVFEAIKANFVVQDVYKGKKVGKVSSENRFYFAEQIKNAEIGILHFMNYDIYLAIGEIDKIDRTIAVRAYYKPYISWVWVGYIIAGIGLLLCINRDKKAYMLEENVCAIQTE